MPALSAVPRRWLIVLAFASVYIIWGSSYFAIAIAIQTIPPFAMSATRFLLAGALLIGWVLLRGGPRPTLAQWRSGFIVGGILFVLNNGLIVYAETIHVPTGVIALLIGCTPMWVVAINMARGGGRPTVGVLAGLALGTLGILLLVNLNGSLAGGASELFGAVVVIAAAFFWAFGSLYARSSNLPSNPLMSTGMQLFCGGLLLSIVALLNGDWAALSTSQISAQSVLAMVYLALFASITAFTAFTWLMRTVSPAMVATYAYVNPVIAVLLGAIFLGETLAPREVLAGGIIIAAVVIITRATASRGRAPTAQTLAQRPLADASLSTDTAP